ncbi:MAG: septal ring lytic transglycosylase RlpA family lipoprotein [Candidatus Omnitrophica bacterium CG02_land_8_20_14_3_00__42_8]|nr:MAG: septal ring lytic transglycosylase RlpA family lipoprotein [Candidatus Omnitrophica bacterium CG02_land_8_20_14_3_00__42_8]
MCTATIFLNKNDKNGRCPYFCTGKASWYSQNDPGILLTTANMERFDDSELTCAMWDMPFNAILKVTNLENGKSVIVRVNDRGPAKRLNRAIDLTKAAFSKIADLEKGLAEVSVEIM